MKCQEEEEVVEVEAEAEAVEVEGTLKWLDVDRRGGSSGNRGGDRKESRGGDRFKVKQSEYGIGSTWWKRWPFPQDYQKIQA